MSKIRELVNYNKIKDVIDIDAISDQNDMVANYVISPALEESLVDLLKNINQSTHKAAQIIGGYGSGKSHLLAFIISILENRDLAQNIQNDQVRQAATEIDRNFAVVSWELQPNDVELSEYFYDNIERQLKEKYGLEIQYPEGRVPDHKANVLHILDQVKQADPTRGLVVVIDEVSDFLKQKSKEKINRDVQFLRVLGQVAQSSDFMFIGAMQELIFTSPKYMDEAESFGRVSERFQIVTIRREDVKRVISRRLLHKSMDQRKQLEDLFNQYLKYFPTIRHNLDDYIDLFPLHPYVVQVFSELPYFEKRGIIQFTIDEVEKMLDEEFPFVITYDLIFDQITGKHSVKNLDTVAPVVNAVDTLESKIDLLEPRFQETARKLTKALAVLYLYGKSTNNGATIEELANTLLIIPENRKLEATDELTLAMKELRKVTDGQFINHNQQGYYYLDLALTVDYDQIIERKTTNLPANALDDEILALLKEQLALTEEQNHHVFRDTCRWNHRRSFREGHLIYHTGKEEPAKLKGDYSVVFLSPFCSQSRYSAAENIPVLEGKLNEDAVNTLKKAAAARLLMHENYSRAIMEKRHQKLKREFSEQMVACYLNTGQVDQGGPQKKTLKSIISREFSNFDELLSDIKPALLEDYFSKAYPEHPTFKRAITRDNIHGEISGVLKDIVSRAGNGDSFSNATLSLLADLELLDEHQQLTTGKSPVAREIVKSARDNRGNNLDVNKFLEHYADRPYGYHYPLTQFIIVLLTFNGEISLRATGGKVITSSEVPEVFGNGLDAFTNIRYLTLESELNPDPLIRLFGALGLGQDISSKLRTGSKRGEAVRAFRDRYLEIKEQMEEVRRKLEHLSLHRGDLLDIPGLKERHRELEALSLEQFDAVKTPADLKKIVYPDAQIKEIDAAYQTLQHLYRFYQKFTTEIEPELDYALEVRRVVRVYPYNFVIEGLNQLMQESLNLLASAEDLLDPGQLNPLLGKLQQIRNKYRAAYYQAHEKSVGGEVNWSRLTEISASSIYRSLQLLKNVALLNKHPFTRVESEIVDLKSWQCSNFKSELLDKKVQCPYCQFPERFKGDLEDRMDKLEEDMQQIYHDWQQQVLTELDHYRDNLQFLTKEEARLVEQVLQDGSLEGHITEELVRALNNLFKELDLVEVSPQELMERIFSNSRVMDYATFEEKLNELKRQLTEGKDKDKIRIKLAEETETEE